MAGDTVQQVKDRLSIIDVVGGYVKLERAGTSLRARCPFHAEKTPSFHVSAERGTYHCFGCSEGGDIFTFVEKIEGLDFKGALKVLAERAGVEIVYERGGKEKTDARDRLIELMEVATIYYASKLDEKAEEYLKNRGMEQATIQAFRLGLASDAWSDASEYFKSKKFSDHEIIEAGLAKKGERGGLIDKFRNRIMFPIADSAGRVIGFSGRIFGEKASPEAPKYLNSPETPLFHKSRILYGFDKAKMQMRKHNFAILVEGQMDLLASHQAGWTNTVAVSGTAFTAEHASLVKRMTENLVLALDADEAGIKAAGRAARAALQGGLNVKVARLPAGKDPADLILEDAEAWRAAIRESKDIITFLLDVLEEHGKDRDRFRRSVEQVVLPFLSDVQSPIAREQYIREIAKRLGVSESAVAEAFAKVPRMGVAPQKAAPVPEKKAAVPDRSERARHAYSILISQESQPKPSIDLAAYRTQLIEALGQGEFDALAALPTAEQESMRFSAELLYAGADSIAKEAETLIVILRGDKLAREVRAVTEALQKAEAAGDEEAVARLMEQSKLYTEAIAKLPRTG
jgi:DNA primase